MNSSNVELQSSKRATENTSLMQNNDARIGFSDAISFQEVKHLLCLTYPMVITFILEYVPGLVSISLVGHIQSDLTKEFIDGAALAVMYVNLTGLSIGIGLATAMDTLCSQAFGAGKTHKLAEHFQTGILVLSIAFVPIFLANYFCTSVLIFLGQPEQVAIFAGQFARYTLLGLPFLFLYELIKKVLQAQNVVVPMAFVALIGNAINIAVGYALVYHTSLGFIGAAIARSIGNASLPLLMLPYLYFSGRDEIFLVGWCPKRAIAGFGRFIALGLPGMLMVCFEWWAFEFVALLAGLLPNAVVSIGANAVLINVISCIFMVYLGVSVAVNIRVGNHLGADNPDLARIAASWGLVMVTALAAISASSLILFSYYIAAAFTNDESIIRMASHAMLVVAAYQIFDSTNATMQGIFRGSGRQILGAQINFVAYYVIGIPLGCVGGFALHWGIAGIWIGLTFGMSTACLTSLWIIYRTNWKQLAQEAQHRTNA